MNKNVKINNPMKVITGPDTRWSYANVWEPKSINGGTPKYSVSLIIPKSDTKTIAKIKAAIEAAYKEGEAKLKGNGKSVPALSVIKTPLRDGDMERPDDPAYANSYFVNANATSAPGIVDVDYPSAIKSGGFNGYGKGASVPSPARKSIDQLAHEVLAGNWGNGEDRKKRLTAAGYDYSAVQARVNQLCGANTETSSAYYTIQSGDTLSGIARKYGTSVAAIQKLNSTLIMNANYIQTGWKIRVK